MFLYVLDTGMDSRYKHGLQTQAGILDQTCDVQKFSPSVWLSFHFLNYAFQRAVVLNFDGIKFINIT